MQLWLVDRRLKGVIVMYGALDGVHCINPPLFHIEERRLLLNTARIVARSFRTSDLVAHWGRLEFAALAVLRVREPALPRPYRVPGGLIGAIAIGIPPAVLLAFTAARSEVEPIGPINSLELSGILIALGVIVYFFGERIRKK